MSRENTWLDRIRPALPATAVALGAAAALIGVVLYVHTAADVPMGTLTRDPLSGKPAYLGLLSQAGILVWAAGAAVCFFASRVLRGAPGSAYLFWAGLLTSGLCIDDAFMLHDEVLPLVGVPEELIYATYLGLVVVFLIAFRRQILDNGFPILMLALAFLGLSVVCDAWGLPWLDPYLLEDGSKFAGITLWTAHFAHAGESMVRSAASVRRPGSAARGSQTALSGAHNNYQTL